MRPKRPTTINQENLREQLKREQRNLKRRIQYQAKKHGRVIEPPKMSEPTKITRQYIENVHNKRGAELLQYNVDPNSQDGANLSDKIVRDLKSLMGDFDDAAFHSGSHAEHKRQLTGRMQNMLNHIIEKEGDDAVAQRIESKKDYLNDLTKHLMYGSDSDIQESLNLGEFLNVINGGPLTASEEADLQTYLETADIYGVLISDEYDDEDEYGEGGA